MLPKHRPAPPKRRTDTTRHIERIRAETIIATAQRNMANLQAMAAYMQSALTRTTGTVN